MKKFKSIEINYIEDFLEMKGGYVLDFSNNEFERFIFNSINIEIYDGKGYEEYCSKANKIRQILSRESDTNIAKLLEDLLEYKKYRDIRIAEYSGEEIPAENTKLEQEILKLIQRLKREDNNSAPNPTLNTLKKADQYTAPSPNLNPYKEYDVFISHASEDKQSFVEPLTSALKAAGIKTWYDADQIGWGESIRESIDKGLINSRYCIVVLSPDFFNKYWAGNYELNAIFQRKARERNSLILPIWHNITAEGISQYNLSLPDLKALNSSLHSIDQIVNAMKSKLN